MKKLCTTRRLDELGRIVLPAEIRTALEWGAATNIDIYLDEDSAEVCLKTHQNSCVFCGTTENLNKHKNRYVCDTCLGDLTEQVEKK